MKISYNWLKQYLKFDLSPDELSKYLTDCGLEVEGVGNFESIKGGLRGLVVGEVLTCEPHLDSNHLHLTTVRIDEDTVLNIVCGAPNVKKGQKVVVATIGTTLYGENDSFVIKKSKIRGAVSEGMICAEDEIGVGTSHEGILELPSEVAVGTNAADYFKVEIDTIFEIGITPNRSDAISHYGVARDLYAVFKFNEIKCSSLLLPSVSDFTPFTKKKILDVSVENGEACPRYSGLTIEKIQVKESPEWLKNRLKSIGIRPINNIVDITQFVMFETGQPLHAFDMEAIIGKKVIVKNLETGTKFLTLDENEIQLDKEDLMICNAEQGMCIAGVYGGINSGVTEKTNAIFLESAYFSPLSVRKSSKRHHLKTDAAFRFERGTDPEMTTYALKRAANLIKELTDAIITSDVIDIYPKKIQPAQINLKFEEIYQVIGKVIDKQIISSILLTLGMEVQAVGEDILSVTVPLFRNDVTRPIDLIEEILRIYSYNNVEIPEKLTYPIHLVHSPDIEKLKEKLFLYLADNGFFEMMNSSLTKSEYHEKFRFENDENPVFLLNPLSNDLKMLRKNMILSGLEAVAHNIHNKNHNLRLFEFGKIYSTVQMDKKSSVTERYAETEKLSLFVTGKSHDEVWNDTPMDLDFYYLKNIVINLLKKTNLFSDNLHISSQHFDSFIENLVFKIEDKEIIVMGQVHPNITHYFDIKKPVFYAEIDIKLLQEATLKTAVTYTPISPYPSVKRDLALVIDKNITYQQLEELAFRVGSKLIKNITLFDVYEGDKIEKGKKSYALNFVLQRNDKTLVEDEIHKVMNKIVKAYEREFGAQLRK